MGKHVISASSRGRAERLKVQTHRQDAHRHQVEGGAPFGLALQSTREVSDRDVVVIHYVPSG